MEEAETFQNELSREDYLKLVKFSSDFFFGQVMQDSSICAQVLSVLLKAKVEGIEYLTAQKSLKADSDSYGVNLDVYVKDKNGSVYDVELQNYKMEAAGQRVREYQIQIDAENFKRGMNYKEMPASYILFICTFDPFGAGESVYTFSLTCEENPRIKLNDNTMKVFYNTKQWAKCKDKDLQALLRYIETGEATSPLTKQIEAFLEKEKRQQKWRNSPMVTFAMKLEDARKTGREEGAWEKAISTAKNFLAMGVLSKEQIAQGTGLSVEEISSLSHSTSLN